MKTLTKLVFKVRRSGYDNDIMIEMEASYPAPEGTLTRFHIFTLEELTRLTTKGGVVLDSSHHCEQVFGAAWFFYDIACPTQTAGKTEVRFLTITVPHPIQRVLVRYFRLVGQSIPNSDAPTKVIEISQGRRERWCQQYGRGTGKLEIKTDERSQEFLAKCKAEDKSGELAQYVQQVEGIARGTTIAFFETAVLRFHKDWDGFYWEAVTPAGRVSMNGGIINHGKDGEPRWSIHT